MHVYVETWVVGDGQIPDLRVGDVFHAPWFFLPASGLVAPTGNDEIVEVQAPTKQRRGVTEVEGEIIWRASKIESAVVRSDGIPLIVEGKWTMLGGRRKPPYAQQEPIGLPEAGARARARGRLWVASEDRVEDVPPEIQRASETRPDWTVTRIRFEHVPGAKTGLRQHSAIETFDVRWDVANGTYLVDLERRVGDVPPGGTAHAV